MTLPLPNWYPASNPGGNLRETARKSLASWIIAQQIRGINHVYDSRPIRYNFDDWPGGSSPDFACLVGVGIGPDTEDRLALTGPADRGGKLVHYPAILEVKHRTFDPDRAQNSPASEDDYDRIVDALKDAIRGNGRDLGRPEIFLMVGEWPRVAGIRHQPNPLTVPRSGVVDRAGIVSFNVTQYLVQYP